MKDFYKKILLTYFSLILASCGSSDESPDEAAPGSQIVTKNILLYTGCEDAQCNQNTLWYLDTDAGTPIAPVPGLDLNNFDDNAQIGSMVYFTAEDQTHGFELWAIDIESELGPENPKMVVDIRSVGSSYPNNLLADGSTLYFSATDGISGNEVWVYETSDEVSSTNPKLLSDVRAGSAGSNPDDFHLVSGKLFFTADDGVNGEGWWVYDTSQSPGASNPSLFYSHNGPGSHSPHSFKLVDSTIYYCGIDSTNGRELWKLDATQPSSPTNPQIVTDLNPGNGTGCSGSLSLLGGKLYYSGRTNATGNELFEFDPNAPAGPNNPSLVADFTSGSSHGNPSDGLVYNGKLIFSARTDNEGNEVLIYDPALPIGLNNPEVVEVNSGTNGSYPFDLVIRGDQLFFSAESLSVGYELYKVDLTANDLQSSLIEIDINPGANDSNVQEIIFDSFGNAYFYATTDDEDGELWMLESGSLVPSIVHFLPGNSAGVYPYDLNIFTFNKTVDGE